MAPVPNGDQELSRSEPSPTVQTAVPVATVAQLDNSPAATMSTTDQPSLSQTAAETKDLDLEQKPQHDLVSTDDGQKGTTESDVDDPPTSLKRKGWSCFETGPVRPITISAFQAPPLFST